MPFSIFNYRKITEQKLAMLPPVYRKCFAVWCLRSVFEFCRSRATGVLDGSEEQFIEASIDELWRHVMADTVPSAGDLLDLAARCNEIDLNQGNAFQGTLLAELLGGVLAVIEVFSSQSARHSMLLGEYCINCIDADFSEQVGISPKGDLSTVPSIRIEIEVQREMICYLESSPKLSHADLIRFRQPCG